MAQKITVRKQDASGKVTWSYEGEVIEQDGDQYVCLYAYFNRDSHDAGYVTYKRNDLFIEYFYADRWYNVFRLIDRDTHQLKGWYCNITRPAVITQDEVASDDLALDVFIAPNGDVLLLDEDEFEQLQLADEEVQEVWSAVQTIRELSARQEKPFHPADTLDKNYSFSG